MVWFIFQGINWAVLLRRDCYESDLPANIGNSDSNGLFENENKVYFQQDGTPPHFHVNVRNFLDRRYNQRRIGRRGSFTEFRLDLPI